MGKRIYFTVTNDLSFDQRMRRICGTLAAAGFTVTLVGRKLPGSPSLPAQPYTQQRIRCWFKRGKLFYAEFNCRLFLFLLFRRMDAICAIDLDTILPCLYISRLKKIPRIYDAHELFTELKEVLSRPGIHKIWTRIEKKCVPQFPLGYTVSDSIAGEFWKRYQVEYATIRNMPVLEKMPAPDTREKFILYQGAVNEARGFEQLIPAMKEVRGKLVICGDGNFMGQLKELIRVHEVTHKVELRGMMKPETLRLFSAGARVAVAVPEKNGLNQYLALPNKFFDYVHAGLPQVTVNYPEYARLNQVYRVAILLDELTPGPIAKALNNLLEDDVLHGELRQNCLIARELWQWQTEEKKLVTFYQNILKA